MKQLVCAAAIVCGMTLTSGQPADPRLQEADLAWDRGDYPAALAVYDAVLNGDHTEATADAIALQTGELFTTTELTADGGTPKFSPDGRYIAFEIGRGVSRTTRVVTTDAPLTSLHELSGFGAAFSPDGSRIAYLKLAVTREMADAERAADRASGAERTKLLTALAALTESAARITVRHLTTGAEREIDVGTLRKSAVRLGGGDVIVFSGSQGTGTAQVYVVRQGQMPAAATAGEPDKVLLDVNANGTAALFTLRPPPRRGSAPAPPPRFGVTSLPDGTTTLVTGSAPAFSPDGASVGYVGRSDQVVQLLLAPVSALETATALRSGPERLDAPAFARDGRRVVFQMMRDTDWELFVVNTDGTGEHRLTRDIQHDVVPRFLGSDRVVAAVGEARHRRSFVHDLSAGTRTRLFHNNTVRTIAPEYEWVPSPDGTRVLIAAERDGDTVSLARGVYLTDLTRKITRHELRARVQANLRAERTLRENSQQLYAPIQHAVSRVVEQASIDRVFRYQKSLFEFDSKHITRPGNRLASAYLYEMYRSFGYEPEYQWFSAGEKGAIQTANVIATLKGTLNPELVYVVSSHYDSVAGGPGADDDSSGTAALLETARLLARHPQPATIVFASFTGEESGLLGSREFVRRAIASKMRIAGALNNDMIGWTNDHRLDNTIRYSNPGIRDIQHAAAMQFSRLITYDALYYKNTDAHAYYEAYGDIVGGIGSYPVLSNPHYHQPHDTLDTINHQLVTEVTKTTTATLMLLASSPSRVTNLRIDEYRNRRATVRWTPSPERDVTEYVVSWALPGHVNGNDIRVANPMAVVDAPPGSVVSVKAVNRNGLSGWDWARVAVPGTESK